MSDTKEVVAAKENPVAVMEDEFYEEAGQGLQNVKSDDLSIPFLSIIQSNSPQRKKNDGAYIEGADEGMVFNTVTKELYDAENEPIAVLACAFDRRYLNWRSREEGGGLLGIYTPEDDIVKTAHREGNREMLPDGSLLSNTAQHYVLILGKDGSFKRAVVSMTSTQLKKSRDWLYMMGDTVMINSQGRRFTPPSYAMIYYLSTSHQENDKGSWYGWKITQGPKLDLATYRDAFEVAKKFSRAVLEGNVKIAPPVDPSESAGGGGGDDAIPF